MNICKKAVVLLLMSLTFLCNAWSVTEAATTEKPTCIVLKFTDQSLAMPTFIGNLDKMNDAEKILEDYVVEKMLVSGGFTMKESTPLTQEAQTLLYDSNKRLKDALQRLIENGDYNGVFEGPGFNGKEAYSIEYAVEGESVSPQVMSDIGQKHGADYLLQGTVVQASGANVGGITPFDTNAVASVQGFVCLVRTSDGMVVWNAPFYAQGHNSAFRIGPFKIGNDKINKNMYAKIIDKAAEQIVAAMIQALDEGTLLTVEENL